MLDHLGPLVAYTDTYIINYRYKYNGYVVKNWA